MSKLYIMVGVPGSGKTTFCKRHLKNAAYIGSDDIRLELYGDESRIIRGYGHVHKVLESRVRRLLYTGHDVVVDCSNISRKKRRRLIRLAPLGTEIIGIYIDKSLRVTLKNNRSRNRHVSEIGISVMKLFLKKPSKQEGFSRILHITKQDTNLDGCAL